MPQGLDYHIHTFYQGCGNHTMTVEAIVRRAEALGLTSLAITDHLNHVGMLDKFPLIQRDLEVVETEVEIFFGCELNFLACDGEFPYSEKIRDDYGFEVAIGGIHSVYLSESDDRKLVDIQHRHHLRTLDSPLVDVLVHPYWFGKSDFESSGVPWWDDLLDHVPESYVVEVAQASAAYGKPIEVNGAAIFYNPDYSNRFKASYIQYLRLLNENGALFTVASDAHDISHLGVTSYVEGVLDGLGVQPERIWRPKMQGQGAR